MDIVDRIAAGVGLPPATVYQTARTAGRRYRPIELRIPGKKPRLVYQPATELRLIQRWCADQIFAQLPVHKSCFSYIKGKNIRAHAEMHRRNNFLSRIDIRRFFPSLTRLNVEDLLNRNLALLKLKSAEEANLLSLLATRMGELVIGAPSSPVLSNALMYDFDEEWSARCEGRGIAYTRYADDIYVSTNEPNLLSPLITDLKRNLTSRPGFSFEVNHEKDVFTSRKRLRRVTGITLTPEGNTSIGRKRKRAIKALIHRALHNALSAEELQSLMGMLAYVDSADPALSLALKRKYGGPYRQTLAAQLPGAPS
ncbi:MAG: retron St85 family RNA-directed DNA polymerase [Terracidiphilus sp.]|jgi:hypothetical protein